jgi:hypothetical protein
VAVLDQLIGLGQRIAHVDHIEMPDIRTEDRVELCPERIAAAKRAGVHSVVRLATEIVRLGIKLDPVLLARDLAGREVIDVVDPAGQKNLFGSGRPPRSRNAAAISS